MGSEMTERHLTYTEIEALRERYLKRCPRPIGGFHSEWECGLFAAGIDAGVANYEKWLQEQCQEPKPCLKCEILQMWPLCPDTQGKTPKVPICSLYAHWQGRQEGYALGLATLWEMVDWIRALPIEEHYEQPWYPGRIIDRIAKRLKAQGIER
jgi:hypothetical protein